MKKILTMVFITFFLITGIFMLIGCNQKKENYIFEVESKDEKNINVVLKDVKKGISKKAEVVISKAESISVKSNLITFVGLPVKTTFFAFGNLSFDSSNPTNILSAFLETHCVAFPGKTLLSCTKYGMCNF